MDDSAPTRIDNDLTEREHAVRGAGHERRLERHVRDVGGEAFVVPKGVVHRTRAPGRTVMLMVEKATVVPTGD